MNISIKDLNVDEKHSIKTTCFKATVCIDDKPAFLASNKGNDEGNVYTPVNGQDYSDFKKQMALANKYIEKIKADLKTKDFSTFGFDLDSLINERVLIMVFTIQDVREKDKLKPLFCDLATGKEYKAESPLTQSSRKLILNEFPQAIFLCDLEDEYVIQTSFGVPMIDAYNYLNDDKISSLTDIAKKPIFDEFPMC